MLRHDISCIGVRVRRRGTINTDNLFGRGRSQLRPGVPPGSAEQGELAVAETAKTDSASIRHGIGGKFGQRPGR